MSPLSQTWLRDVGLLNAGRPCLIASDCLAIGGEGCGESVKNPPSRPRQPLHETGHHSRARQTKKEHKPMKTTKIRKLALIGTATAPVSHRRVLLQSRAVKLIGLLSAVAVAACAHTTAHTTEMSKTGPATTVPTPGRGAVTFDYLQRARAGAVRARSRRTEKRATAATRGAPRKRRYRVGLQHRRLQGGLWRPDGGRRRRRDGHPLQCRWGWVAGDCAALYGGPAALNRRAHAAGGNRPRRPYPRRLGNRDQSVHLGRCRTCDLDGQRSE